MTSTFGSFLPVPRPGPHEHPPFASTYIEATARVLARRGSTDAPSAILDEQVATLSHLLANVDEAVGTFAYAPGKWTLVESLLHVADTERVFAYRLLRIARGDETPLPGFDQDAWVPESRASRRTLKSVLSEFTLVRSATVALVASLDEPALERSGTASNHAVSARALIWMIVGHAAHHIEIISERYLGMPAAS